MHSIKIKSGLNELGMIVSILVKNNYVTEVKSIMKEFPCEKEVDYYLVTYKDKED